MAKVFPFQPYRYTSAAGPIDHLVTQPYDKISPAAKERYRSLSPHNLVRIILGDKFDSDTPGNNAYTRAADHFRDWTGSGVLARDPQPGFYAYFQDFADPDSGAHLTRKGFIGLGQVEEYESHVVHRHEQTLSGPKKDRLELLRATRAHFGQIFMLYPDPAQSIDRMLDEAAMGTPVAEVRDEYDVLHRMWPITDSGRIARIQTEMVGKKLIIADGHHRYETALNYSHENGSLAAQRVMMTFVNMNSPGLRILATHRLVRNLSAFDPAALLAKLRALGPVAKVTPDNAKSQLSAAGETIRLGIAFPGEADVHLLEIDRAPGALDVNFLHRDVLGGMLGITEEAVRDESHLGYVRGIDAALAELRAGHAQVAFLLQPTAVDQVADVSFSGGVMPQKSTDFYPKLLSGLTIYSLG